MWNPSHVSSCYSVGRPFAAVNFSRQFSPKHPTAYLQDFWHRQLGAEGKKEDVSEAVQLFRHWSNHVNITVVDLDACLNTVVDGEGRRTDVSEEDLLWLLTQVQQKLKEASQFEDLGRQLTSLLWALSRIAQRPGITEKVRDNAKALLMASEKQVQEAAKADDLEPRYIGLAAWSFAKVNLGSKRLFEDLGDAALQRTYALEGAHAAHILWSFASLKLQHPVVDKIIAEIEGNEAQLSKWDEQSLSGLAWALSMMHRRSLVFGRILRELEARIDEFSMQGLATVLWACAVQKHKLGSLPAILDHIRKDRTPSELSPRATSGLAWSIVSLNRTPAVAPFLLWLADSCLVPHALRFGPQDVSNTLWAFATANIKHKLLFAALGKTTMQGVSDYSPQSLANVAWACAKLRLEDRTDVLQALVDEATKRDLHSWKPQSLVTLLWAAVDLGLRPGRLLEAVSSQAQTRGHAFNDMDLAQLVPVLTSGGWETNDRANLQLLHATIEAQIKRRPLPRTNAMLNMPPR